MINKTDIGESREVFIKRLVGIPVRQLLIDFTEKYILPPKSICVDIWSGSGNEVIYLLGRWYKIIAIDGENASEEVILSRINEEEKERFEFKQQKIWNLKLPQNIDLAYSFYTLQFCKPELFDSTIKTIQDNIISGWFFVGNFLGKNDDRQHLVTKKKEEIEEYFWWFTILSINEKEYDRQGKSSPTPKHRHEIEIIAQKR